MASFRTCLLYKMLINIGIMMLLGVNAQIDFDGGRAKMFGKQDAFDTFATGAKPGSGNSGMKGIKKNPDCPKSDNLSPFSGIAFVDGDILVRFEDVPNQYDTVKKVNGD